MADQFIHYTALDGDRWDTLADIAYGDEMLFAPIIAANPAIAIADTIPAGASVFVPVLASPTVPVDPPPWLQPLRGTTR